jgi:hypothetical protein
MQKDWQAIYQQLGVLAAEMPKDLAGPGPITQDMHRWMGQVCAAVEQLGRTADSAILSTACDSLGSVLRQQNAATIGSILHRALAVAESHAPAAAKGAFVPVGHGFDAFTAIGKILGGVTREVLIVDPYMDAKALTEFSPLAPEGVSLHLLADENDHKPNLLTAAEKWRSQYRDARPLEVRLAPPRTLHDRLIVVDGSGVWTLTQSLNAFASRSPATIVRVDPETAAMKAAAFADIWDRAKPV